MRAVRLPPETGAGTGQSLLTLGSASYPILKAYLGLSTQDVKHLRRCFIPLFWRHDTYCRDFRLDLELACERSDFVSMSDWRNEADLRRSPIRVELKSSGQEQAETVELVPDGTFSLELQTGQGKTYYVEMDCGTELSPSRFKRKLRAYFGHVRLSPTPVLVVVPSDKRKAQLERWIREEAEEQGASPKIFALALRSSVGQETILHAPIWSVVDGPASMPLVPHAAFLKEPEVSIDPYQVLGLQEEVLRV